MSEAQGMPKPVAARDAPHRRARSRALWLRLFAIAAGPVALLAAVGFLLARSLGAGGVELSTPVFERYFLGASLLAVALAALLAAWLHGSLGSRVSAVRRALAKERANETGGLERQSGWEPLSALAREALALLERAQATRADADELAQLREHLESLTASLEEWTAQKTGVA